MLTVLFVNLCLESYVSSLDRVLGELSSVRKHRIDCGIIHIDPESCELTPHDSKLSKFRDQNDPDHELVELASGPKLSDATWICLIGNCANFL